MHPVILLLWLHILCMISVVGALLTNQLCTEPAYRNAAAPSRAFARLANILLGIGLLAGLAYYVMIDGMTRGGHYNGVIGMKFALFLGAGALLGMSKRTDRGDTLRWIALALLVLSSLFGITLN